LGCNGHARAASHDSDLVGDLKGLLVLVDANVSLLLSLGGDEGVDFLDVDFVDFFASSLDHFLVGLLVDDEDEGVVVLDVLDGGLRAQGVLDHGELIEGVLLLHSSQDVLGVSLLSESSGSLESNLGPDLSLSHGVGSLLDGVGSLLGSFSDLNKDC